MVSKRELQQLENLEKRIQQMEAKKLEIENRLKEKERKARTKRLIQVGALFEKHFEFEGSNDALKFIYALKKVSKENREKIMSRDLDQVKVALGEDDKKQPLP